MLKESTLKKARAVVLKHYPNASEEFIRRKIKSTERLLEIIIEVSSKSSSFNGEQVQKALGLPSIKPIKELKHNAYD